MGFVGSIESGDEEASETAKFARVAPAKAGTADRSGSGGKGRRRSRDRGRAPTPRGRRSARALLTRRPPKGPPFRRPNAVGARRTNASATARLQAGDTIRAPHPLLTPRRLRRPTFGRGSARRR